MKEVTDLLQKIGFSKNESLIYATITTLGEASAGVIARQTGIKRGSVYSILTGLIEKGLCIQAEKEGVRIYRPEPPQTIRKIMDKRRQELARQEEISSKLIPILGSFQSRESSKPRVRYFESIEGLQTIQEENEVLEGDVIQIIGYDAFLALYPKYKARKHYKKVIEKPRRIRSIIVTERDLKGTEFDCEDVAVLPPELTKINGEMSVCADRLMLFSYDKEIVAIEIRSKSIAETAFAALEIAWNEAKRLDCK